MIMSCSLQLKHASSHAQAILSHTDLEGKDRDVLTVHKHAMI